MKSWSRIAGGIALCGFVGSTSDIAFADGPLGPNGSPIETSAYSIDLHQGAVLAGTRVAGLAGAYVAIAEDVDGNLQNPATPANRPFYSNTFFDWWIGLGATFPGSVTNTDFFNSGGNTRLRNQVDGLLFFTPALNLQWGPWGVGTALEVSDYKISEANDSGAEELHALFNVAHIQVARAFADGQFVAGLGNRFLTMDLQATAEQQSLFTSSGAGFEAGILYRPSKLPFRFGAAARTPISTHPDISRELPTNEEGDIVVQDDLGAPVYVPRGAVLPWDVNIGIALQLGKRPLNRGWRKTDIDLERAERAFKRREEGRKEELTKALGQTSSPEEQRRLRESSKEKKKANKAAYREAKRAAYFRHQTELARMSRRYVLISASMLVAGSAEDSVGIESFLEQEVRRSGENVSYSARLGVESEVLPDLLKLRGGSYYEPPRLDAAQGRVHGTLGFDLRLIRWSVFGIGPDDYLWRLGVSVDAADRYFAWGIMVGGWYPRHGPKDLPLD